MKDITNRKELVAVVDELKHRLKHPDILRDQMALDLNRHLNKFIELWGLGWDQHNYAKLPEGDPPINAFVRVSKDHLEHPGLIGRVEKRNPDGQHVMLHNCLHWFRLSEVTEVPEEEWHRWREAFR